MERGGLFNDARTRVEALFRETDSASKEAESEYEHCVFGPLKTTSIRERRYTDEACPISTQSLGEQVSRSSQRFKESSQDDCTMRSSHRRKAQIYDEI